MQLDQGVAGESAYTDGGADVAACFPEESDEEVGCAVDDGGGIGEACCGVYVAIDGEDLCDGVECAEFALEDGELREGAGAGGDVTLVDGAVCAGLAGDDAAGASGDDSGEITDGADALEGYVVAAGCWRDGESKAGLFQLFFSLRCGCHGSSTIAWMLFEIFISHRLRCAMRLFLALLPALFVAAAIPTRLSPIQLHTERTSPGDLEIGGELAGIPHGGTRYLRYDDLLKLPQKTFTVKDDNFHAPVEVSGVGLADLAKMLGEHADMIVAICYDSYESDYSPEYLAAHDPLLVMRVNGKLRDGWPKEPNGDALTPYVIANPAFKPSFKVLAHDDEEQIPYGVTRLEFRNGAHIYASILPAPAWRENQQVMDGYKIAREDCFRCHNSGEMGGTMGKSSWPQLAEEAVKDPERFREIIVDPEAVRHGARMPGRPHYDRATLDALVAYFRTFAKGSGQ